MGRLAAGQVCPQALCRPRPWRPWVEAGLEGRTPRPNLQTWRGSTPISHLPLPTSRPSGLRVRAVGSGRSSLPRKQVGESTSGPWGRAALRGRAGPWSGSDLSAMEPGHSDQDFTRAQRQWELLPLPPGLQGQAQAPCSHLLGVTKARETVPIPRSPADPSLPTTRAPPDPTRLPRVRWPRPKPPRNPGRRAAGLCDFTEAAL